MQVCHIILRSRTALNEMTGSPFINDDQRMFELPRTRSIQAEVALQRHRHLYPFWHVDKRTAGPGCVMQRRKFMVRRRNQSAEDRSDQIFILLDCRLKVHVDNALLGQRFMNIVVNDLRIILSTDTGERSFLRFRNAQTIKGITDILRQLFPASFHICTRPDIGIDMRHIKIGNIRHPRRNIQLIINFQRRQSLLEHPLRLFLLTRYFTNYFFRKAGISLKRILNLILNIIDASIHIFDIASLFLFMLRHFHHPSQRGDKHRNHFAQPRQPVRHRLP